MGLNFSNSDVQWAYSGFAQFRKRLAADIGINLEEMQGFGGAREWDHTNDGIVPFLSHSDCDGELTPLEMSVVAPRLRTIVSKWEDCYDKQRALELSEDMMDHILNNIPMQFM